MFSKVCRDVLISVLFVYSSQVMSCFFCVLASRFYYSWYVSYLCLLNKCFVLFGYYKSFLSQVCLSPCYLLPYSISTMNGFSAESGHDKPTRKSTKKISFSSPAPTKLTTKEAPAKPEVTDVGYVKSYTFMLNM